MKKNVVVLVVLTALSFLMFSGTARSEAVKWQAPTTYTDGTSISPSLIAILKYYVRIDQSNPRDSVGKNGFYYLGEVSNGGLLFPTDNALGNLLRSFGFDGRPVKFTVSASYIDNANVEEESAQSPPYSWTVPMIQASQPSLSPVAGSYSSVQTVTLASVTAGASIRYTTDGTTPSSTVGILYSAPFQVATTTTVKAIAYKSLMADSAVTSGTYTVVIPSKVPGVPKFILVQ
jgi:hypothetical protein